MALVRAADSEQDAAIYLTAAFTGLRRGELVALRWRDVDFPRRHIRVTASYTERMLTTPTSGKVRSVPMAPAVAEALARLNQRGAAEVMRLLEHHGWELSRTRGSHRRYRHPTRSGKVTLAGKPSDTLHPKTLASIFRQAGIHRP